MKKQTIHAIKAFVNNRFMPQGIEFDLNYIGAGCSLDPANTDNYFNLGRTIVVLREAFPAIAFSESLEYVNDSKEKLPVIVFQDARLDDVIFCGLSTNEDLYTDQEYTEYLKSFPDYIKSKEGLPVQVNSAGGIKQFKFINDNWVRTL